MGRHPDPAPAAHPRDDSAVIPAMDNLEILAAFERGTDGAWHCIAPATIATEEGTVRVEPGMSFAYGQKLGTLDVAEYLEQLGASFGS